MIIIMGIIGALINIFIGAVLGAAPLICGIIKKKIGLGIGGMGACIGTCLLLGWLFGIPLSLLIAGLFIFFIFMNFGSKEKADSDIVVVGETNESVEAEAVSEVVEAEDSDEVVEAEFDSEVVDAEAVSEVVEAEAITE